MQFHEAHKVAHASARSAATTPAAFSGNLPASTAPSAPKTGTWEAQGIAEGYAAFAATVPYSLANASLLTNCRGAGVNWRNGHIVEIGSGTGTGTELIRALCDGQGKITCIDCSKPMIDFAAAKWRGNDEGMRFVQSNVDQLRHLNLGPVSHVFCLNAITLFPNLGKVLRDIYDILPPGGIFAANNTLIQDAVDLKNSGDLVPFFRGTLRIARARGISSERDVPRQTFISSCDLLEATQRVGFNLLHAKLETFNLERADLFSYASVPGTFHELVGGHIPQQERLSIIQEALAKLPETATFPRRWISIVAQKPVV